MYLVSIYFDEKTNKTIQSYINRVAEKTGNSYMLDGCVPSHITISAIESKREEEVIEKLQCVVKDMKSGKIQWVSTGQFLPYVVCLLPVLNEYLHLLSKEIYDNVKDMKETIISPCYRPFQWMPHTTVGKKLSKEEMRVAFSVLQDSFVPFDGSVRKIGIAKTNPYREIISWDLKF